MLFFCFRIHSMFEKEFQYKFEKIKTGEICQNIELQFNCVIVSIEFNNPNIESERDLIDKIWQDYVRLHGVLLRKIGQELKRELLTDSQALLVDEYITQMKMKVVENRELVNKTLTKKRSCNYSVMFFGSKDPTLVEEPDAANFLNSKQATFPENKASVDYLLNIEPLEPSIDEIMTDCFPGVQEDGLFSL